MKPLLTSILLAIMILLLFAVYSCGTRKTNKEYHEIKSNYSFNDSSYILTQNVRLNNIGELIPIDNNKPFFVDGKEYFNVSIKFDKSKFNDFELNQKYTGTVNGKSEITDNKQTEKSKSKSIIRLNGNWYRLNYNLAKPPMNAGKYVEIATYSQDIIANMHRIMATMCTPVRLTFKGFVNTKKEIDHSKLSDEMFDYDFAAAYQSCVFFYAVFSKSIQSSPIYFKSISPMKNQMEAVVMNLHEVLVGYITQKWFQNLKISV